MAPWRDEFALPHERAPKLLVKWGWALDWPRYSGGAYAAAQAEAKANGRGPMAR